MKKLDTSAFSNQSSTAKMLKEAETLHYVPASFSLVKDHYVPASFKEVKMKFDLTIMLLKYNIYV
ncbi:hypothetical protein [Staphylococcus marylandisciuri]|uniref:hypothetical protein n=1 Tax=Staphylococcus marylandisciuri TaxID=2981529 RepID=UPI0021CE652C|nr:hypothetical protein [Staphylococcus marylandisciuri]